MIAQVKHPMHCHKKLAHCFILFFLLLLSFSIRADELRPAYLQITETGNDTYSVLFRVPARGENERLALNVEFDTQTRILSQPFSGFDSDAHNQFWNIVRLGGISGAAISISKLERTTTEVLLRIAYLDGSATVHRFTPDAPTYTVERKATWFQIVSTYLVLGVEHILFGVDHLLFVFVLLLLVREFKKIAVTITAFTLAHSITLILAALNVIHISVPPVEACIALSIAFVATEIIRGKQGYPGITARKPWLVAFGFGLLHGLGFASALSEIGLPQTAIVTALVFFNVGVEIGQLLFVSVVLIILWRIKAWQFIYPQWIAHVPPYVVGGVASFWIFERVAAFW